VHTLGTFGILW